MGQPAARQNDTVTAVDIHIILIPTPGGPVPTPLPHPFNGILTDGLSTNVFINSLPAATQGSAATNTPPHIPQGGPFQIPPTNRGTILMGSMTVMINSKPAARLGDTAMTCNDPADLPAGTISSGSPTVMIG